MTLRKCYIVREKDGELIDVTVACSSDAERPGSGLVECLGLELDRLVHCLTQTLGGRVLHAYRVRHPEDTPLDAGTHPDAGGTEP